MAEEALQPQSLPEDDLVDLLIDGARYDDMDDVKMALDQHINVNATDSSGRTALHMASANGHASIVMALIDAGADVSAKNEEGNTPLHYACLNGHIDTVKLLMMHGASPSDLNRVSKSPVDEALGRPFQQGIIDVINSFFKEPIVQVDQMQEEEVTDTEADEEMASEQDASEHDDRG